MKIVDIFYNTKEPKCVEYEVLDEFARCVYVLIIENKGGLKACISNTPYVQLLEKCDDADEYFDTIFADALEAYEFADNRYNSIDNISIYDGLIGIGAEVIKKNFDPDIVKTVDEFKGNTLIEQ